MSSRSSPFFNLMFLTLGIINTEGTKKIVIIMITAIIIIIIIIIISIDVAILAYVG